MSDALYMYNVCIISGVNKICHLFVLERGKTEILKSHEVRLIFRVHPLANCTSLCMSAIYGGESTFLDTFSRVQSLTSTQQSNAYNVGSI